jgi:4-amino-4-deoxy-L-arabinose transferase-like glycosyltransferase
MVKISRTAVLTFFILAAVLMTLHPLLALPSLPFKLFLVYAIIFTAALFLAKDIKIEKKGFAYVALFTLGAACISAGQYVFSFFLHHIMSYGAALMLAGIAVIVFAEMKAGVNSQEQERGIGPRTEAIIVAVLFVVSFGMRAYDLAGFLPGVWFDEAQNAFEAQHMLHTGQLPVFVASYTNMPAMFFYFCMVFLKIFGMNILPFRLVSAVLGSLSVAAFYFLCRQVFKSWKPALLGAFLLAFSRWHITFSRVAFMGMQTVLFEIIFFYFYLKFLEEKKTFYAVVAGAVLGLAQYTFSAANFILIFVALHMLYLAVKDIKVFIREYFSKAAIMAAVAMIAAGPLIGYAIKHPGEYFRRAGDVSIARDIKEAKSIMPVFKNLATYALTFNFEGDYQARHNLYKKPLLDDIGAVFFIIGFAAALANRKYRFFAGLFFVMLLPGLATITIEAPQAYRIIGSIPAVYIIIVIGIKAAASVISSLARDRRAITAFFAVCAVSIASINAYQYYYLYPRNEFTFLSFSPEANGIAGFIKEKSDDYVIIVSQADKMYGFYMWEQSVVLSFLLYNGGSYTLVRDKNDVNDRILEGKKGVVLITRPTDKELNVKIESQYAGRIAEKMEYKNPYSGDTMYTAYYINKDKLLKDKNSILYKE